MFSPQVKQFGLGSCYPLQRWRRGQGRASSPWHRREPGERRGAVRRRHDHSPDAQLGIRDYLEEQGHEYIVGVPVFQNVFSLLTRMWVAGDRLQGGS